MTTTGEIPFSLFTMPVMVGGLAINLTGSTYLGNKTSVLEKRDF